MSSTDTDDRAARSKALDEFATAPSPPIAPQPVQLPGPVERVFGAQQVAVYRDEARILQKLAALGAAAGTDWFYRYPVKTKGGGTDWIEGASIKLANDVARIYGNCDVDVRVQDLGNSWLFYARFIDFETGYGLTRPFQQYKGAGKIGGEGRDSDNRRLDMAFQIGASKAIRNVVVNALQTYSDHAFDAARNSLVDRIGKDVNAWRGRILTGIENLSVPLDRVELAIGRIAKDWTAPDIAKVIAMCKAISDGMTTVDETFPPKDKHVGGEQQDQPNTSASSTEPTAPSDAEAAGSSEPSSGPDSAPKATSGDPATSSSQQQANPAAPAAASQAAPDANSPKDKAKGAAKGGEDKLPTNEKEYVAFATAWIDGLTDPDAGAKRWLDEKNVRNKGNVGGDARDDLKAKLDAKIAELRKAGGK